MSADHDMVAKLVERYALAEFWLERQTSRTMLDFTMRVLEGVKEQAQILFDVIINGGLTADASERLADAERDGLLQALNELRNLDLDSIRLRLPDTRMFEQRGVHR